MHVLFLTYEDEELNIWNNFKKYTALHCFTRTSQMIIVPKNEIRISRIKYKIWKYGITSAEEF